MNGKNFVLLSSIFQISLATCLLADDNNLDSADTKNLNNTNSQNISQATQNIQLQKSSVTTEVSQSELPIELQSKAISVVEKSQILERVGVGGPQALLEQVPGILYSRSGGINGQITIRGQNSNLSRAIIMIDGVRYSGRNTLDLNVLDPTQFDSIEVIRGAASSIWGSDAQNGVINFRSRKSTYNLDSDKFKATARMRALEYNSVNDSVAGRLEVLGGGGGWDMLVGLSGRHGIDYLTPVKENGSYKRATNSRYESFNADFNLGYTNSNNTRYYAQGRFSHIESHRAGGLGAAPGSESGIIMSEIPIREYFLRTGVSAKNLGFADGMDAYVYWRHWDTDIWNDRRLFNQGNYIHQQVYDNNYVGSRVVFDKELGRHSLAYGLDIESSISRTQVRQINLTNHANPTTNTTNRPSSSTDLGVFIKDDFSVSDSLILNGALRADYVLVTISKKRSSVETNAGGNTVVAQDATKALDNNDVIHTGALTGSLGSVYFFNDYVSNVFNISHNFRVPGAGTRMQTTPSGSSTLTTANPHIKPEYSQTAEFGFRFQNDSHFLGITSFFTNYTNMVALSTYQSATAGTTNNVYRYENIGKAYITGVEFEGRHSFFDSTISLHYTATYNYGYDMSKRRPIAYLAPLYGNISLRFNFARFYLGITERTYAAKQHIDNKEERVHKGYAMTDIALGLKLGTFSSRLEDMELIFGVSNLFNAIGRNPATAESISHPISLTNPLVEPGRNFTLKYVWKY